MLQLVVGSAEANGHFLPSIQFSLLVQGLIRARLWQRVRRWNFSCEHWLGPVSHPCMFSKSLVTPCILFIPWSEVERM